MRREVRIRTLTGMSSIQPGAARHALVTLLLAALAALLLALPAAAGAADLQWSAPQQLDSFGQVALRGAACPSTTQCTAVDANGHALTFNPDAVGNPGRTVIVAGGSLKGVACPSVTECVAGVEPLPSLASSPLPTVAGNIVAFNPQDPRSPTSVNIDAPDLDLLRVICPTTSQCSGIADGSVVTFDPRTSSRPVPLVLDHSSTLGALACPTATQCTAVGQNGNTWTFNPQAPASAPVFFDTPRGTLTTLACPSAHLCTAVDDSRNLVTLDLSDPSAPTVSGNGTNVPDGSLSCVSDSECFATDLAGNLTSFDPTDYAHALTGPAGSTAFAVLCQTASHCVAATLSGNGVGTIDPQAPSAPAFTQIDYGAGLYGLWCSSEHRCVTFDGALNVVTFDPQNPAAWSARPLPASPTALTCASATRCIETDINGRSYAFDPGDPSGASPAAVDAGHVPSAVACPSASLCVLVDVDGGTVVYDPGAPPAAARRTVPIPGEPLISVSCPATTQCTVAGANGKVATLNPQAATAGDQFTLAGGGPRQVFCTTTAYCQTVDATGARTAFDPHSGAVIATLPFAGSRLPLVPACRTASDCLWTSSSGELLEADPQGPSAATSVVRIPGINVSQGIACPAADFCVVVDLSGQVSVGTIPPPPAPPGTGTPGTPSTPSTPTTPARTTPPPAATRPLTDTAVKSLLARLLASGAGLTPSFKAPAAGRLTIRWTTKVKKKTVTIASGTFTYKSASLKATKIRLRLTKKGKSLLKHHKKLKVTSKATFTIAGRRPLTATRTFTLKR